MDASKGALGPITVQYGLADMEALPTRDFSRILDLAVAVLSSEAMEPPWKMIMDEAIADLRGNVAFLTEVNWPDAIGRVLLCTPASLSALPLDSIASEHIKKNHPLAKHYATTSDRTPLAITDVVDDRVWRSSEAYALTRDSFGSNRHLVIPMPAMLGTARGFVFHRNGPDFGDRERSYARRLQALLVGTEAHFQHLRTWRDRVPEQRLAGDAADEAGLTPREITVLILLSESLTAEAIGRRLGISARTVHKHLEKIYRKLCASNRLAAVLRAKQLGLLP